jgi:hypothetical protein
MSKKSSNYAKLYVLRGPSPGCPVTVEEFQEQLKTEPENCPICNGDKPAAAVVMAVWLDALESSLHRGICADCARLPDATIKKRLDKVMSGGRPKLTKKARRLRLTPEQRRELDRRIKAEHALLRAAATPCSQDAINMAEALVTAPAVPSLEQFYLTQAVLNVCAASNDIDERMSRQGDWLAALAPLKLALA